jgi:hypothetical protein
MNLSRVLILVEPRDPVAGLVRYLSSVDSIITIDCLFVLAARRWSPILAPHASFLSNPTKHRPRKNSIQTP